MSKGNDTVMKSELGQVISAKPYCSEGHGHLSSAGQHLFLSDSIIILNPDVV